MECNKEEALRARELAEKKLCEKDYETAQKLALKAQRLSPSLENVTKLITVCEVHISALKTNNCWYGVLSLHPNSDEVTIKKQYRKLALLLHPDKNKLPGAEAAFKLISEANNILSDRAKRSIYDIKRSSLGRANPNPDPTPNPNPNSVPPQYQGAPQPARNFNSSTSGTGANPNPNSNHTFWTVCPYCKTKFQYYSSQLGKHVLCMTCKKYFVARLFNAPVGENSTRASNLNSQWFNLNPNTNPNPNPKPSTGTKQKAEPNGNSTSSTANPNPKPKVNVSKDQDSTRVNGSRTENGGSNSSTPLRRSARNKMDEKYNVTEDSAGKGDTSGASNDFTTPTKKPKFKREQNPTTQPEPEPKSNQKNEKDPTTKPEPKPKSNQKNEKDPTIQPEPKSNQKDEKDPKIQENGSSNENPETETAMGMDTEPNTKSGPVYPDPEFCDFDRLKTIDNFSVDQIWALYDDLDGMPRFYARIRHIYSGPGFKLRYNWLEHNPKSSTEQTWSDVDLPVACGTFTLGDSEISEDRLLFSHLVRMPDNKGKSRVNNYVINPKKGEVWAVFKDWDIKWCSEPNNHRSYEYVVVEALSNFDRTSGVLIIPLVRVEGFVSLFVQDRDSESICVKPEEMLRFSHSLPSYRLNGKEREGVPEGSLELDTTSLPSNYATTFPSVKIEVVKSVPNGSNECNGNSEMNGTSGTDRSVPNERSEPVPNERSEPVPIKRSQSEPAVKPSLQDLEVHQYPDAEFYNFESDRTPNTFQRGQIWAIYCDLDSFPKYYGFIRKVESEPFKAHVIWLEACPKYDIEDAWLSKDLPLGTGTFMVTKQNIVFETTDIFSHSIEVGPPSRGNKYEIIPDVDEIWAVYKNWSLEWATKNIHDWEYEIVVVKEQNENSIKASRLEKVEGYKSVFKLECGDTGTVEIPDEEYVKFSHRLPAFLLTEERGGKLRGFWELDPAALPDLFLYTS